LASLSGAMSGAGWGVQGSIAQVVATSPTRFLRSVQRPESYSQSGAIAEDSSLQSPSPTCRAYSVPRRGRSVVPPAEADDPPDGKVAVIPVELIAENDAQRPESAGEPRTVNEMSLPLVRRRM
jgi:hypothetical protein